MQTAHRELSQAAFAEEMGVTPAAVSQWKKRDILRDDAFTKPRKKGKVIYHLAVEQVRRNRDVGQALGNGIATRTSPDSGPVPEPEPDQPPASSQDQARDDAPAVEHSATPSNAPDTSVEGQLKQAKLEQQLRKNRQQAVEEAKSQSALMAAGDVRDKMAKVAGMMLQIFEGALPDIAAAVSAQFDAPQRDVLHLLKAEFKKVRATAAMKERLRAGQIDQTNSTAL